MNINYGHNFIPRPTILFRNKKNWLLAFKKYAGTYSPTGHKHVAIVGKRTHRMPMETTAEYSSFRSMGKQGIEEKEGKEQGTS